MEPSLLDTDMLTICVAMKDNGMPGRSHGVVAVHGEFVSFINVAPTFWRTVTFVQPVAGAMVRTLP